MPALEPYRFNNKRYGSFFMERIELRTQVSMPAPAWILNGQVVISGKIGEVIC